MWKGWRHYLTCMALILPLSCGPTKAPDTEAEGNYKEKNADPTSITPNDRSVIGAYLYVKCNTESNRNLVGVASIVRTTPLTIVTAAHVLKQAGLPQCQAILSDYAPKSPCEFSISSTRHAATGIATYPFDLASAKLQPIGESGCKASQTFKFVIAEQRNGKSNLKVRYLNYVPDEFDRSEPIEPVSNSIMPELIVQRPNSRNDPSKYFYGGFSGSPAEDVAPHSADTRPVAVGIVTTRLGKAGGEGDAGLPMALVQRIQDVTAFPDDLVKSVFKLVDPSPQGLKFAHVASQCPESDKILDKIANDLDAFDQYYVISIIKNSAQCPQIKKKKIYRALSDRLFQSINSEQIINVPSFSNENVNYSNVRKCGVVKPGTNDNEFDANIKTSQDLYVHAMREINQEPNANSPTIALRLRRSFALAMYDRASCQIETKQYFMRPQFILSGLAQSIDNSDDMAMESIRLFAGLFSKITRASFPNYTSDNPLYCGDKTNWKCNIDEGYRIRMAGIAFKLQDICYLIGKCPGGDVIESASILQIVLDSNHNILIHDMPDRRTNTSKFVKELKSALSKSSKIFRAEPSDDFYFEEIESDLDDMHRGCAYKNLTVKGFRPTCSAATNRRGRAGD